MAKNKCTPKERAAIASNKFPTEFKVLNGSLWCLLCKSSVNCDKLHRQSKKHLAALKLTDPNEQSILDFTPDNESSWHFKVTKAFLDCNIPLQKMTKKPLRTLFAEIGKPLPSETKCRSTVKTIHETTMESIRKMMSHKKVFIVTDESDVGGQKYVNTLLGLIADPTKTYLVECQPIYQSPNAQLMLTKIDDVLKYLKIERTNLLLLLSDAARYMVKAGETSR